MPSGGHTNMCSCPLKPPSSSDPRRRTRVCTPSRRVPVVLTAFRLCLAPMSGPELLSDWTRMDPGGDSRPAMLERSDCAGGARTAAAGAISPSRPGPSKTLLGSSGPIGATELRWVALGWTRRSATPAIASTRKEQPGAGPATCPDDGKQQSGRTALPLRGPTASCGLSTGRGRRHGLRRWRGSQRRTRRVEQDSEPSDRRLVRDLAPAGQARETTHDGRGHTVRERSRHGHPARRRQTDDRPCPRGMGRCDGLR
ncbi:MAG: hypothetical protein JWN65_959 [Solirubrobacterales bacterium]|nr:hypothetical protein [Solirubrobacterales bacterium]